MDKSDAGVDYVNFWLRRNGADLPESAGIISLQGNAPAYMMAAWNYLVQLVAGDVIELYWGSADVNMEIIHESAQTSPFAHPAVQSTILTITQQSGIMAGTGITAINSLTGAAQTIVAGTTETDFAISSSGTSHTFNLPDASATARDVITTGTQTIAGTKTFSSNIKIPAVGSQLILQVASDGTVSGMPTATYASPAELIYVKGVTSAIQTQINGKQAIITGAATTITTSDLTASRALISNASGKVAVSTVTDTELGYVSGVTSEIQTQLNSKGYTLALTSVAGNLLTGQTYYFGNVGRSPITTADQSRVYIPKTGTIKKAYITQYSGSQGTITSITVNIRLNNTTDTLVATSTTNTVFRTYNNNALSINVTEGDYIEIKVTSVSSVAPITNVFGGTIYIE
jgi:fructose-specific component phosphotransferase system IIB-like protein